MLPAKQQSPLKGSARLKVWGLVLLGALIMTFAHEPVNIPFVGMLAFAPTLLALPHLKAGGAWLAGVMTGLIFWGINIFWLSEMVTDPNTAWIIFGMYVLAVLIMTTPFCIAFMAMRWALTRQASWTAWLVPFIWLGFEFVNEFNTPAPFPWLPAGSSIIEYGWIIQTADIWGVYGLTLIVVLVGLVVARMFRLNNVNGMPERAKDKRSRVVWPLACLGLLVACSIYGVSRPATIDDTTRNAPRLGSVQGNMSQEVKERQDANLLPKSFRDHMLLTEKAVKDDADMVVWAETMLYYGATREGYIRSAPDLSEPYFEDGIPDKQLLQNTFVDGSGRQRVAGYVERLRAHIAHRWETPMLVGTLTNVPKHEQIHAWKQYDFRRYNAAMAFDDQGRVDGIYDKRFLVPGGEYVPWEDFEISGWAPIRDLVVGYAEGLQGRASYVEPGQNLTIFNLQAGDESYTYTSSICYEYAFPACYIDLSRAAGESPPDFHVNISNEGWFKRSSELDHAVTFCRLRCIETRVPMLHTTNTGVTCAIDVKGNVIERLFVDGDDREVQGLMMVDLPVVSDNSQTIFVRYVGRLLGYISFAIAMAVLVLMFVGRIHDRQVRKRETRLLAKDNAADESVQ
ncbi:MAG: apolipoprotein N-acyltransferase [Planctomycetota bacterium]|jgi:apolipoprotein N-acyltransferase